MFLPDTIPYIPESIPLSSPSGPEESLTGPLPDRLTPDKLTPDRLLPNRLLPDRLPAATAANAPGVTATSFPDTLTAAPSQGMSRRSFRHAAASSMSEKQFPTSTAYSGLNILLSSSSCWRIRAACSAISSYRTSLAPFPQKYPAFSGLLTHDRQYPPTTAYSPIPSFSTSMIRLERRLHIIRLATAVQSGIRRVPPYIIPARSMALTYGSSCPLSI